MSQTQLLPGRGATRAEIVAWAMYDWANSAFSTILITVLYQYLTTVVFDEKDVWGSTLYAWGISASMMTAAFLSPIVGALADANRSKRRWLGWTAMLGAGGAVVLSGIPPQHAWAVIAVFTAVSLCFELSLGVYNGFLPEIATEETMNRVSAWGFAAGYLGGALALVLAVLVTRFGDALGLPAPADQLRAGILIMGLWWGGFSIPTILVLRDRGSRPAVKQPLVAAAQSAVAQVGRTLKSVRRYRMLAFFLVGFLFYNEGVQTVLNQSSTFATKEIGFTTVELVLLILMIQVLALPGAVFVGWLSDKLGQRSTLFGCLAVWVTLLAVAWFITEKWQFWALGGVVAMVMGGTQSVSRAIMGVMTPPKHTAEFFGFFNFSGKATSFMGSFVFGTIFKVTGSARPAIVSLLVFFLLGWAVIWLVNVAEGRRQAMEE